jgi:hypothetical protein
MGHRHNGACAIPGCALSEHYMRGIARKESITKKELRLRLR